MNVRTKRALKIIPALIILYIGLIILYNTRTTVNNFYYDEQISAYEKMEEITKYVISYKKELGLPIYDYDFHNTGLLGDEYNEYTTSLGHLESKRTSTNPDMAAMVVKMFKQIGLKPGDHVGVGFSGSFPALNIAVISAGEVMDLDYTVITSFGSSTFGANQKELSFPKLLNKLYYDGVTKYNSSMVTLGGDNDAVSEKETDIIRPIIDEYNKLNLNLVIEPDYENNIQDKIELYEQKDIDCFVAVGGNLTFLGMGDDDISNRQGILKNSGIRLDTFDRSKDGLINYFLSKNVPTIHLLNVRKIVADYGLAFDPPIWPEKGTSNVFKNISYNKNLAIVLVILSSAYLIYINKDRY